MHYAFGLSRENGRVENRISCSETTINFVIDDGNEKHIMLGNIFRSNIDEKNMVVSKNVADVFDNAFSLSDRYTTSVSGPLKFQSPSWNLLGIMTITLGIYNMVRCAMIFLSLQMCCLVHPDPSHQSY